MKICIDAGHGMNNSGAGYDPGAIGAGVQEADIALLWALTLKAKCADAGIDFWMTRDDATDRTPVGTRDDRAKAEGCTHFISLHCNSSRNPLATGTETIYRQTPLYARLVQQCGLYAIGRRDRGIKTEGEIKKTLAVLAFPRSALLEIGFISNGEDRRRMLDRQRRIDFADSLVYQLKKLP